MITCLLIDDEPRNNLILQNLLETYCRNIAVSGTATSVSEALPMIDKIRPDVIFLDIEMPGQNAFDLLQSLRPVSFQVVFVTAFDQYAVRAFRFGAIDYLLKPVNIDELIETVQKLQERLHEKKINQRIEWYLDSLQQKNGLSRIAVNTKDGYSFHETTEILYCEAEGAYTRIFLEDGRKILSTGSLKFFEDLLADQSFFRVHHSSLVNMQHVLSYSKGRGGFVTMKNGVKIEVSHRKKEDFLAFFETRPANNKG